MPRRLCVVALLLAATSPLGARRQTPSASYRWIGTGTLSIFRPPPPGPTVGSTRDDRTIQFRLKEARQLSVTDAGGRVIGQILALEDDGSQWTGRASIDASIPGVATYTGSGSGSGLVKVSGILYRSVVTPNPLADVLPDGSYQLSAITETLRYPWTVTMRGKAIQTTAKSINELVIGDSRLGNWLQRAGLQPTEAAIRVSMAAPPTVEADTEGRSRRLEGDRMVGTWSNPPGLKFGQTGTASWELTRTGNIPVTLTEVDRAWRPRAETSGDVTLTASIDPSLGVKGRFRFTLYDVSREPGSCLNAEAGSALDLAFSPTQPRAMTAATETADGWTIETTAELTTATVSVHARDYGAWGKLKAEVIVGGELQRATTARGGAFAAIPLDDNNDHIADEWMALAGIPGHPAAEDADSGPTGANDGDGLSNYEEYRGFMVGGVWTDTDPTTKDLFINNEATPDGCGFFPSTGVACQLINPDEYKQGGTPEANRVVNFNAHYATAGPQKGLLVISQELQTTIGPGTLGVTWPAIGTPNDVDEIRVDLHFIAEFNERGVTDTGAITPIIDARMSVIAHELGHAVGIDHHGANGATTACGSSGVAVGEIAVWGGAYSGDRECFMSYARADQYQRSDGSCHLWPWAHRWGTSICRSRAGTGINAGPERVEDGHPLPASGDATNGDCAHTLRIRK